MARNPAVVQRIAEAVGLTTWDSFIERACDDRREKFYNGGWRGSKTYSADFDAVIVILTYLLAQPGKHLIWLIGPDYEQARPDYFNLEEWFTDHLKMHPKSSEAQEGSLTMIVQEPGTPGILEITTKSASKPSTLGAVGPKLIIVCEAGQMPETARDRIRGRASTHNAPIIWNGTFENEEGKPQYTWFEEESKRYKDDPTPRRKSYSLPIWENIALFGDCREMIYEDPSLAMYCPDDNHGPAHSGIATDHPDLVPTTSGVPLHPKVRELYEECRDKPTYWRKYYAGEPVGVLGAVYEWAGHDKWNDLSGNKYLISMSEAQRRRGAPFRWLRSAGGTDFGTVHPSALCVGSINSFGDTWVRHAEKDTTGAIQWVWAKQKELSRTYHIPKNMWGLDPMAGKYSEEFTPGVNISGGLISREQRVGIVEGVAMNPVDHKQHLFFDADDPGVVLLFREMQLVHRRKNANGQASYVRENDDMTASFEDMIAMLHGQPVLDLPKKWSVPRRRRTYVMQESGRGVF